MYVCMFMCMYRYMYVYICLYIYVYVYVCMYMYIYVFFFFSPTESIFGSNAFSVSRVFPPWLFSFLGLVLDSS